MLLWLLIIATLVFALETRPVINSLHAGFQDEEHGITHAVPALVSTWLVYLAYAVILGFTYGWLAVAFPIILDVMKYGSAVILCVLAFLVWTRDKEIAEENYLTLGEEFIIKAISVGIPLIMIVMYSLFLDFTKPLTAQIIVMTIGVVVVSFLSQVVWVVVGLVVDNEFFSTETVSKFDKVMTGIIVLLAVLAVFI
jgi:threonine/homoserine/homoserine lactone efflux protein